MLKAFHCFIFSHLCWLLLFISVIRSAATDPVPAPAPAPVPGNCEGETGACQVPSDVPLDTNRYLVMMHPQKSKAGTVSNKKMVTRIMSTFSTSSIMEEFDFGATWGFRATLTPEQVEQLQGQSSVRAVVKERIVSLDPIVPASEGTHRPFPWVPGPIYRPPCPHHPGYPQPGYPQPGYPQPGYPQPGYPSYPGYPQPGYPSYPGYPNYPQPGYPQPGHPEPSQPTPPTPEDTVPPFIDCPAPDTLPVCPARSNPSATPPASLNDSLLRHRSNCWGLSRIYSKDAQSACDYIYPATAGEGVLAYVVDSGINVQHREFLGADGKSRAIFLDDLTVDYATEYPGQFPPDNQFFVDTNGHGTHVAGTIGGAGTGVAGHVTLVAVRVMNRDGRGTNTGILKGLARAYAHWRAQGKPPAVVNLSLGGEEHEPSLLTAIDTMMEDGMHFAIAAGNSHIDDTDDKYGSPQDDALAIIVAASDKRMEIAEFSNYGRYITLFAPGVDIFSTWIGGDDTYHTISGTSMASPHVAGVIALYLSNLVKEGKPLPTTAQLKKMIVDDSQQNVVTFTYNDYYGTKARTTANKFLSTLRLVCTYL